MDEAGGLDGMVAGVREALDELGLDAGIDCCRLVLQAVARPDLVDRDARRQSVRGYALRAVVHPMPLLSMTSPSTTSTVARSARYSKVTAVPGASARSTPPAAATISRACS